MTQTWQSFIDSGPTRAGCRVDASSVSACRARSFNRLFLRRSVLPVGEGPPPEDGLPEPVAPGADEGGSLPCGPEPSPSPACGPESVESMGTVAAAWSVLAAIPFQGPSETTGANLSPAGRPPPLPDLPRAGVVGATGAPVLPAAAARGAAAPLTPMGVDTAALTLPPPKDRYLGVPGTETLGARLCPLLLRVWASSASLLVFLPACRFFLISPTGSSGNPGRIEGNASGSEPKEAELKGRSQSSSAVYESAFRRLSGILTGPAALRRS
mmetsp:Transcript_62935/g.132838  ORF Transcript_62935/g.132838 Transcript_62935/m.132838 type:complete len:269 (+) Transcript_62935:375-1181(+)